MVTSIATFFRDYPVFTHDLLEQTVGQNNRKSPSTIANTIKHHLDQGHIVRIKRGLFASVPYGADSKTYPISPFLVAASLAKDAVIAYHSALAFHGVAYSSIYRFIYLTQHKPKPFEFRGEIYQPAAFPASLVKKKQTHVYVKTEDAQGIDIQVTSKERTLVDLMDRPLLGGGWEEIWRSLDMIERLKIDSIIDYALLLENATTIAKVGFYLEQRKKELAIDKKQLDILKKNCPVSPHYMDDVHKGQYRLIKDWNLMVPLSLINRDWEEDLHWEQKI